MTASELREKYIRFFVERGHQHLPSGSLVPYDILGKLDESLLFNGAGMVQFKPYFRGIATPPNPRIVTHQKVLRTGDIEEVGDFSHLTFFEMLGNFSFGSYGKQEAIDFSWEFLTNEDIGLGISPYRLAFTVFEEDEEAVEMWSKHLTDSIGTAVGYVFRLGEDTNYWPAGSFSSGPPGPCGPNTEIFYRVNGPLVARDGYDSECFIRDESESQWLEIWNNVFILYDWIGTQTTDIRGRTAYVKQGMEPLPFSGIDTGMGLERTAAILSGSGSVYDTDVFQPLLAKLAGMTSRRGEDAQRAMRIVSDHARASVFCIADGVIPSNTGRGYVLRRLIRRAMLKAGTTLEIPNGTLLALQPVIQQTLGHAYPELAEHAPTISQVFQAEEESFQRTLDRGKSLLQEEIEKAKSLKSTQLPGEVVFRLYDTYGFPIEVSQEIAHEGDLTIDEEGLRTELEKAQERSRAASNMATVYSGEAGADALAVLEAHRTEFLGYEHRRCSARIVEVVVLDPERNIVAVALDKTVLYASSGGQVADEGVIILGNRPLPVLQTMKRRGAIIHTLLAEEGLAAGTDVQVELEKDKRASTERHHTATHLLHAALRTVLGSHVTQAGSYVGPDRLRFDFTHGQSLKESEILAVEDLVNEQILAAQKVITYSDIPLDEARKMGAMALFGEKYGDRVRVVQVGEAATDVPSFSRELCGGTHVRNTGEIGLFMTLSEGSVASGIRRIEATAGHQSLASLREIRKEAKEIALALKASQGDSLSAVQRLQERLREATKAIEKLRATGAAQEQELHALGDNELVVITLKDADAKAAEAAANNAVHGQNHRSCLAVAISADRGSLVLKLGSNFTDMGADASKILRTAAQIAGGGGGGRPNFATAGIRDVAKLPEVVASVRADLAK